MLVRPIPNENGVLATLSPTVYDRLRPSLNRVRLEAGTTLFRHLEHHLNQIVSGVEPDRREKWVSN
jgi:hypothetical protein